VNPLKNDVFQESTRFFRVNRGINLTSGNAEVSGSVAFCGLVIFGKASITWQFRPCVRVERDGGGSRGGIGQANLDKTP